MIISVNKAFRNHPYKKQIILAILLFLVCVAQHTYSSVIANTDIEDVDSACCNEGDCPEVSIGVYSDRHSYQYHCIGCTANGSSATVSWYINGTKVNDEDTNNTDINPMGNGTSSTISYLELSSANHTYSNVTCKLSDSSGGSSDSVIVALLINNTQSHSTPTPPTNNTQSHSTPTPLT